MFLVFSALQVGTWGGSLREVEVLGDGGVEGSRSEPIKQLQYKELGGSPWTLYPIITVTARGNLEKGSSWLDKHNASPSPPRGPPDPGPNSI